MPHPLGLPYLLLCGVNEKLEAGVRRLNLNEKVGQLSGFEVERDNSVRSDFTRPGRIYASVQVVSTNVRRDWYLNGQRPTKEGQNLGAANCPSSSQSISSKAYARAHISRLGISTGTADTTDIDLCY